MMTMKSRKRVAALGGEITDFKVSRTYTSGGLWRFVLFCGYAVERKIPNASKNGSSI
jgi:hypothetical protein